MAILSNLSLTICTALAQQWSQFPNNLLPDGQNVLAICEISVSIVRRLSPDVRVQYMYHFTSSSEMSSGETKGQTLNRDSETWLIAMEQSLCYSSSVAQ